MTVNSVTLVEPANPQAVPLYGKAEWVVTLTTPVSGVNAFNPDPGSGGLDLRATFSGPGGGTWPINGFYDATTATWRLRFSPTSTGQWTFSVTATDAAGTSTWSSGALTCIASAVPGFAKLNGPYMQYSNGTAVRAVGHNNGWQYEGAGIEQPSFQTMAGKNINLLSFWLATPWAQPEWASTSQPWWAYRAPLENSTGGIGNYNAAACTYLDGVVTRAEAQGVYLLPSLWSAGELRSTTPLIWGPGWWSNNAYSSLCSPVDFFKTTDAGGNDTPQWRHQKNRYRYLIARYGYSRAILGWIALVELDGTTGYNGDGHNQPQALAWCNAVRSYFAANDAYRLNGDLKYPISVSRTGLDTSAETWLGGDFRAMDSYDARATNAAIAPQIAGETLAMRAAIPARGALIAEFGGEIQAGNSASQPTHLNNGLWASISAGAMLPPIVWCDGGDYPLLTDASVGVAMQERLQHLSEFLAGTPYFGNTSLVPTTVTGGSTDQGWASRLGDRGFGWLVTSSSSLQGHTFSIGGVSNGTYRVEWFNTAVSGNVPVAVTHAWAYNSTLSLWGPWLPQSSANLAFRFRINAAPIHNNVTITLNEDTPTALTLNASDPDGDPLTYPLLFLPYHGTLTGTGPNLTYTPAANFNGTDIFYVYADDGAQHTMAEVRITVLPVDDGPDGPPTVDYNPPPSITNPNFEFSAYVTDEEGVSGLNAYLYIDGIEYGPSQNYYYPTDVSGVLILGWNLEEGLHATQIKVVDADGLSAISPVRWIHADFGGNSPWLPSAPTSENNPVLYGSTVLSVVADDNAGEPNLIYTWAVTAGPNGATPPSFGESGTNAAKSQSIVFTSVGSYTFQVTVQDQDGFFVVGTVDVEVVSLNGPPGPPADLAAVPNSVSNSVALSWTDTTGNATFYRIERRAIQPYEEWPEQNDGYFTEIATVSGSTAYVDTSISVNDTYYYRVRASNGAGDSDYSYRAQARWPAAQPTNFSVQVSPERVATFTWEYPFASNPEYYSTYYPGPAHYMLEVYQPPYWWSPVHGVPGNPSAEGWGYVGTWSSETTSLSFDAPIYGYLACTLRAHNPYSAYPSNSDPAGPILASVPPPTPTIQSASAYYESDFGWIRADIVFDNNIYYYYSNIDYSVERVRAEDPYYILSSSTGSPTFNGPTSFYEAGAYYLNDAQVYIYRVRSRFLDGYGSVLMESTPAEVEVRTPVKSPEGLTLTASQQGLIQQLTWTNTSAGATHIRIERAEAQYYWYDWNWYRGTTGEFMPVDTVSRTYYTQSYDDFTVGDGIDVVYRVVALWEGLESPPSNETEASVPITAPAMLVASRHVGSHTTLEWIDHAIREEEYVVERQLDFNGFEVLATVPANTMRYDDAAALEGGYYTYRVAARRILAPEGEGARFASYSNETMATIAPAITSLTPSGTLSTASVDLAVTAVDDGGHPTLFYQWVLQSGAGPVGFSAPNASTTTATFQLPGTYVLKVRVSNGSGAYTDGEVVFDVVATLTTLSVTPATATVITPATKQFTAHGRDQFNAPIAATVNWSAEGGTINGAGLFTPGLAAGTFTVQATAGELVATAQITVQLPNVAPTLAVTTPENEAAYTHLNVVSVANGGATIAVAGTASDDLDVAGLSVTWWVDSSKFGPFANTGYAYIQPGGALSFNAFASHGTHTLKVRVTDGEGLFTETAAIPFTVDLSALMPVINVAETLEHTEPSTLLRADASYVNGEELLTYHWTVKSWPGGPAAPVFSANNSNGAKLSSVTTPTLGNNYVFTIEVRTDLGLKATQDVPYTSYIASPNNVTAAHSFETVAVTWEDASTRETAYRIERREAAGSVYTLLGLTGAGETSFMDTTFVDGTEYVYQVTTVANALESAPTESNPVTPVRVLPPPGNLTVAAEGPLSTLVLRWTDTALTETGFVIERADGLEGFEFLPLAEVGANIQEYLDTTALECHSYTYRMRTINASGVSADTDPAAATRPLAPPAGLAVTYTDYAQVNLGWTNQTALTNIEVYVVRDDSLGTVTSTLAGMGSTSYSDANVGEGIFRYRVYAYDPVSGFTSVPTDELTVFRAPAYLTAYYYTPTYYGDHGSIELNWSYYSPLYEGFVLERSENGGEFTVLASFGLASNYMDSAISEGVSYQYRVKALHGSLSSEYAYSETLSLPPPLAVPVLAVSSYSGEVAFLSISMQSSDLPAENAVFLLEYYNDIDQAWQDIGTYSANNWGDLKTVVQFNGSFGGYKGTYRARMALGWRISPYSETLTVTTTPETPYLTAGTVSTEGVYMSWSAPFNVSGVEYRIERSIDGERFERIHSAVGASDYSDSPALLLAGHSLTYRVQAANNGKISEDSNAVTFYRPDSVTIVPQPPVVDFQSFLQFTAVVSDSSGQPLVPQPGMNWSLAGVGTIDGNGLFHATTLGHATLTVDGGGLTQTIDFDVIVLPTITVSSATDANAAETVGGTDTATFRFYRTGSTATELTFKYDSRDSTATNGVDHNFLSGTATFPVGASTVDVIIAPVNDGLAEAPESVILGIFPASHYHASNNGAVATIHDNTANPPVVSVMEISGGLPEGHSRTLTIARSGVNTAPLTVPYTLSGTATNGVDYAALSGTAVIPAGQGSVTVLLAFIDDNEPEFDETVVLTLQSGAGYTLGNSSVITGIADNEPTTVTVEATDATATETSGNTGTFKITQRGIRAVLAVNLSYSGTAVAADTNALPSTLSLHPGALTRTVTVTPVNDTLSEYEELLVVAIANGAGYVPGAEREAYISITDNDAPVVVVEAEEATAYEGPDAAPATVTFLRAGDLSAPLTVNFSLSGSAESAADFAASSGSPLTFEAGSASASLTLDIIDDAVREGDETIAVTLLGGTGYTVGAESVATVTIIDDELPTISITAEDSDAAESGDIGVFAITRTGDLTDPLTLALSISGTASAGSDYRTLAASVTFDANVARLALTVMPREDAAREPDETVIVTLPSSIDYNLGLASATVTIADNDTPVVEVQIETLSGIEGGTTPPAFRITRKGPLNTELSVPITVSGTATSGTDYTAIASPVSIPVNHAFKIVTVAMVNDALAEGVETVSLTALEGAAYALGEQRFAAVSIIDNDVPTVALSVVDAAAIEGSKPGMFQVSRTGSTTASLTVYLAYSGSAAPGTDFVAPTGIIIPAGATTRAIDIFPIDDAVLEGPESVVLTVVSSSLYQVVNPGAGTVTIADDDRPINDNFAARLPIGGALSVAVTGTNVNATKETGEPVHATSGGTSVWWTWTAPGTGAFLVSTEGSTFYSLLAVYTGTSVGALTPVVSDRGSGPNGTGRVYLQATAGSVYAIAVDGASGATGSVALAIAPALNIVTIAANSDDIDEAGTASHFTLTREGPTGQALTVQLDINGSATAGDDYAALPMTVEIPAGDATKNIVLTPVNDSVQEGSESVTVSILEDATYKLEDSTSATIVIIDDDLPVVAIAGTGSAKESGATGAFTVSRTGATGAELTVHLMIGGTAVNGVDVISIASSVTIPAGAPSETIAITAINDTLSEGRETVVIGLVHDNGYGIGDNGEVVVAIVDNDLPAVSVVATTSIASEGLEDAALLTFTRTGSTDEPLSVSFSFSGTASEGADYDAPVHSVTIDAGQPSAELQITPLDDALAEGEEYIFVRLAANPLYTIGTPQNATVRIMDNDVPAVSIELSYSSFGEPGASPANVAFSIPEYAAQDLALSLAITGTATAGADYISLPTTVTIPAGKKTASLTIRALDDGTVEATETIIITLQSSAAYTIVDTGSVTASLTDNDAPTTGITVTASPYTVAEGAPVTFTFSRPPAVAPAVLPALTLSYRFGGTATKGPDYTTDGTDPQNQSVFFPANDRFAYMTVTTIADTVFEGNETLVVTVPSSSAGVVIQEASLPQVRIAAIDPDAAETGPNPGLFRISANGILSSPLTVTMSRTGTATSGDDYAPFSTTATIPAGTDNVIIPVLPVEDDTTEGTETVILSLNTSASYTLGAAVALVNIRDNDQDDGGGAGGGGGGGEDPEPPTITISDLTITDGLTGDEEGMLDGEFVHFTKNSRVSVNAAVEVENGQLDGVTITAISDGRTISVDVNGGTSGSIDLPDEGRYVFVVSAFASNAEGLTADAEFSPTPPLVLIVDRTAPVISIFQPFRYSLTDDGDTVYLNGMYAGDNTANRRIGINAYLPSELEVKANVVDASGLSTQTATSARIDGPSQVGGLTGSVDDPAASKQVLALTAPTADLPESVEYADDLSVQIYRGKYTYDLKAEDRCGNPLKAGNEFEQRFIIWVDRTPPKKALPARQLLAEPAVSEAPNGQTELIWTRHVLTSGDAAAGWQQEEAPQNRVFLAYRSGSVAGGTIGGGVEVPGSVLPGDASAAAGKSAWLLSPEYAGDYGGSPRTVTMIFRDIAGNKTDSHDPNLECDFRRVMIFGGSFPAEPDFDPVKLPPPTEQPVHRKPIGDSPPLNDTLIYQLDFENEFDPTEGDPEREDTGIRGTQAKMMPIKPKPPDEEPQTEPRIVARTYSVFKPSTPPKPIPDPYTVTPLDPGDDADRHVGPAVVNLPHSWQTDPVTQTVRVTDDGIADQLALAGELMVSAQSTLYVGALARGFDEANTSDLVSVPATASGKTLTADIPLDDAQPGVARVNYTVNSGMYAYKMVTGFRWMTFVGVKPDVVSTGNIVTLRISGGFIDKTFSPESFTHDQDCIRFVKGGDKTARQGTDLTVPNNPNRITILRDPQNPDKFLQRFVINSAANETICQAIEVTVEIGREVSAGACDIEVNLGAVKAYPDSASQANSGTTLAGSHKIKDALNVVKIRAINSKSNGEIVFAETMHATVEPKSSTTAIAGVRDLTPNEDTRTLGAPFSIEIQNPSVGATYDLLIVNSSLDLIGASELGYGTWSADIIRAHIKKGGPLLNTGYTLNGTKLNRNGVSEFMFVTQPANSWAAVQYKPGQNAIAIPAAPGDQLVIFESGNVDSRQILTAYGITLDVNNNGHIYEEVDHIDNYLPGYIGDKPVLSTGTYKDTQFQAQKIRIVVAGLGRRAGITKALFAISRSRPNDGYCANKTDPKLNASNWHDFSFEESSDGGPSVSIDTNTLVSRGVLENRRVWTYLWCKDYAARCEMDITIESDRNPGLQNAKVKIPIDDDSDELADAWERKMVQEYKKTYGPLQKTELDYFSRLTTELADADGANTDGGRDLDPHKTTGDQITTFNEYRGYVLDGGGFDANRKNAIRSRHVRLSCVSKELLVEVDAMGGIPQIAAIPYLTKVMERVSQGFSDKDKGCGLRLYYILDQLNLRKKTLVTDADFDATVKESDLEGTGLLADFVHLVFIGAQTIRETGGGITKNCHSYLEVETCMKQHKAAPLFTYISFVTAHELTHLLLRTEPPYSDEEHLANPDPADGPNQPLDYKFLMYDAKNEVIRTDIIFAVDDIKNIRPNEKEGVGGF